MNNKPGVTGGKIWMGDKTLSERDDAPTLFQTAALTEGLACRQPGPVFSRILNISNHAQAKYQVQYQVQY